MFWHIALWPIRAAFVMGVIVALFSADVIR